MNTRLRSMALALVLATAASVAPALARSGFTGSSSGALSVSELTQSPVGCVSELTRSPVGCVSELTRSLVGCVSELTQTWICDRSDNICGLDDARMLSKPCKVDYDALLKATPEMKKITNDKIDPNSSEGINLRQKAVDRIRDKAEAVRTANGYCSVWKTIRHADGRNIPDITDLVKAQL